MGWIKFILRLPSRRQDGSGISKSAELEIRALVFCVALILVLLCSWSVIKKIDKSSYVPVSTQKMDTAAGKN
jgi:hypothetical protein